MDFRSKKHASGKISHFPSGGNGSGVSSNQVLLPNNPNANVKDRWSIPRFERKKTGFAVGDFVIDQNHKVGEIKDIKIDKDGKGGLADVKFTYGSRSIRTDFLKRTHPKKHERKIIREDSAPLKHAGEVDKHAVWELNLEVDNDSDYYHNVKQPWINNVARKIRGGRFDKERFVMIVGKRYLLPKALEVNKGLVGDDEDELNHRKANKATQDAMARSLASSIIEDAIEKIRFEEEEKQNK